jgi:carbonic anhydrase
MHYVMKGLFPTRTSPAARRLKHDRRPTLEALEKRTVLTGSSVSVGISAAVLNPSPLYNHVHESRINPQPVLGTISGTVTNNATGKGLRSIRVQLIDSQGDVVGYHLTNARGRYQFKIKANGPYVVREVTPKRFVQTSPTFAHTAPQGSFAPGAGNSSWSYDTGNSNPAFGPVGVYAWDTVAPAGNLPFESPINITAPPIDLSKYLTITYNNAVPSDIINNSHQIQVRFPGSSSDSITVGGQEFELAQFHYHDPSENTVDGQGYSMEEHFVNTSASGAETVVAVFLQLGAYNPSLQPSLDAASANLTQPNSKTTITTPIDFAGLLPSSMKGWFYEGSLTTPALSQPVNWFVFSTPITLDFQQLREYENVASAAGFLPNARPVQPLDGRQVNEFNFDVNFQNQSVAGLNFSLSKS